MPFLAVKGDLDVCRLHALGYLLRVDVMAHDVPKGRQDLVTLDVLVSRASRALGVAGVSGCLLCPSAIRRM